MVANQVTTGADFYQVLADALESAAKCLRDAVKAVEERPEDRPVASGASFDAGSSMAMSVTEAAKRLGISRSSAYEAVRSGQIPSLRLGRRLLVPVQALAARLDELSEGHDLTA